MNRAIRLILSATLAWSATRIAAQGVERADPAAQELVAPAPNTSTAGDPGRLVNHPLKEIGERALEGGEMAWGALLVAAGLLVVIVSAIAFQRWWTHRHETPPPWSTFLLVARKLELTWPDRLLLWRIARANRLPTPLTLLLASGTLYHHGRQYAAGLSVTRRKKTLRQVAAIQRMAFGERAASEFSLATDTQD